MKFLGETIVFVSILILFSDKNNSNIKKYNIHRKRFIIDSFIDYKINK